MKENIKIKVVIIALIFSSFFGGFSTKSFLDNEAQYKQINDQLTKLVEIDKKIVELEKKSIELKEKQSIELEKQQSIKQKVSTTKPKYNFSEDEIFILAQLLCGQGGRDGDGEYDFESQISKGTINWFEINKVLEVVMNRTLTPGIYSDNVKDVVLQPGAFSVFPRNLNTTPSPEVIATVRDWCSRFNGPDYVRVIPENHYWFSASSRGSNATRDHL